MPKRIMSFNGGRGRSVLAVVTMMAASSGCGWFGSEPAPSSKRAPANEVGDVLEKSMHALASGNVSVACEMYSDDEATDRAGSRKAFCESLRKRFDELSPDERDRIMKYRAANVRVDGDRATGFLRYGECIIGTSGAELARDTEGRWRIERTGGPPVVPDDNCTELDLRSG